MGREGRRASVTEGRGREWKGMEGHKETGGGERGRMLVCVVCVCVCLSVSVCEEVARVLLLFVGI